VLRFAVLLLVAAISTARAQGFGPEGRVILAPPSIVESSCGKWTNTPTHERALLQRWVTGYLSGINMKSDIDFLRGRDADGLKAWIDDYCRRNPLQGIMQALHALENELRAGR
jgi:hypothetical protein